MNSFVSSVHISSGYRSNYQRRTFLRARNTTNGSNSTNVTKPPTDALYDPAKCGRYIGRITQKIEWISNPDLDFLDGTALRDNTKSEACTLFTGFIYMIEKAQSYDVELKLVRIYIKQDSGKIQFFQSLNPASQFHTIENVDFIKIGQKINNSYCFDIISSSKPDQTKLDDVKNKRGSLTLCATSVVEQKRWVKGLIAMKECTTGNSRALLADFTSVNDSIQKLKDLNAKPQSPLVKASTFYSNTPNVYEEFQPIAQGEIGKVTSQVEVQGVGKVSQAATEIHNTIKNATLAKEQIKKDMAKKLEEVKQTQKAINQKKKIIQRLVESRLQVERQKTEAMMKDEADLRREAILKKANEKLKKVKEDEIAQVKKTFEDKIKQTKAQTNLKALEILKCIKDEDKDKDSSECTDEKQLFSFENTKHVEELCLRFYGEAGLEKCKQRNHFCPMCCGHFIGIKFPQKLDDCTNLCTNIVENRTRWRGRGVDEKGDVKPSMNNDKVNWRKKKVDPDYAGSRKDKKSEDLLNFAGDILDPETGKPFHDEELKAFELTAKLIGGKNKPITAVKSSNNFSFIGAVAGKYKITCTRNGFIETTREVTITAENSSNPRIANIVASRPVDEESYRVIMIWDNVKTMQMNASIDGKTVINTAQKQSSDGSYILNISDKFDSPLIEVMTIKPIRETLFYISNEGTETLGKSNAELIIIKGQYEEKRMKIKEGAAEKFWHIFKIVAGKMIMIDSYTNSADQA